MNNKGEIGESFGMILGFFILVGIIMALGIFIVIGSSTINFFMDEVTPVIDDIGIIGDTNITQAADYTITPINSTIQSFTWLSGVIYFICILGVLGLAFGYRTTTSKVLIPIFFLIAFLMIIASIIFSNVYQDFYTGGDEIASIMHEHSLLSYLILNSPIIFTVVIFIGGIVMFSGLGEEGGYNP